MITDLINSVPYHAHREASVVSNDIPEESGQFRFLRATCFTNIKGSVGLILAKASALRISIPLDLSSRPFIPLPRFIRSRRSTTLLAPSLVFSLDGNPGARVTGHPNPVTLVPGHFFYFLFFGGSYFFSEKKWKKTVFALCFFSVLFVLLATRETQCGPIQ